MHVRTPKERAHEDTTILLAKSVGNKGVLFDARMSMEYHVAQLSKNLGFYLQILRHSFVLPLNLSRFSVRVCFLHEVELR